MVGETWGYLGHVQTLQTPLKPSFLTLQRDAFEGVREGPGRDVSGSPDSWRPSLRVSGAVVHSHDQPAASVHHYRTHATYCCSGGRQR